MPPTRDSTLMPSSCKLPKTQLSLDPCGCCCNSVAGSLARLAFAAAVLCTGLGAQGTKWPDLSHSAASPCSMEGSGEPRVQPSVRRMS